MRLAMTILTILLALAMLAGAFTAAGCDGHGHHVSAGHHDLDRHYDRGYDYRGGHGPGGEFHH